MTSEEFVVVLTTFPANGDVEVFASTLVQERLAACVNVLPNVRSIYTWDGKIERADERQLLIKTRTDRVHELETRLKALHRYEIPEFLVIPVMDGSREYLSWIATSTD
ncbi:MAG TPA: divalent-cation tolerance protein CutA [Vicinamibacterales bacterium]